MGGLEDILNFISPIDISGLPSLEVLAIPFILGLVAGLLVRKVLKIAIIVLIILAVATFLGLNFLDGVSLQQVVETVGSLAYNYGIILIGMLPLTGGFVVGAIIGFIVF